MNIGLQQGSVLCLLLFDVVSSGLPSELLTENWSRWKT